MSQLKQVILVAVSRWCEIPEITLCAYGKREEMDLKYSCFFSQSVSRHAQSHAIEHRSHQS